MQNSSNNSKELLCRELEYHISFAIGHHAQLWLEIAGHSSSFNFLFLEECSILKCSYTHGGHLSTPSLLFAFRSVMTCHAKFQALATLALAEFWNVAQFAAKIFQTVRMLVLSQTSLLVEIIERTACPCLQSEGLVQLSSPTCCSSWHN